MIFSLFLLCILAAAAEKHFSQRKYHLISVSPIRDVECAENPKSPYGMINYRAVIFLKVAHNGILHSLSWEHLWYTLINEPLMMYSNGLSKHKRRH